MIYTCEHCHFTFERTNQVKSCPDCGKPAVREATEKEKAEHTKNQKINEAEDKEHENIRKT